MARRSGDAIVRRGRGDGGEGAACADSRPSCRRCCCRSIPTTSATSSSKSAPARAATSRRCSRGDLFRMYTRFAERSGWQVEIVSESQGELGGYKEGSSPASSARASYSKLKFESGGHRVQRVPETEAQGRIHTSACTVAVMPEADPVVDERDQSRRSAHRHVPRVGRGRPARQQDRLRGAHHALADRASSSNARTTARSTATARRQWPCSRRGCIDTAAPRARSRRRRRCARA